MFSIVVCRTQDTLRARKSVARGINAIDQVENLTLYSLRTLDDLPQRRRKHFSGTSHGNKIGDLTVPAVDELWLAPKEEREKVLGNALKQVGGPTPGVEVGRGNAAKDKKDTDPIWHHTMDKKFYKETMESMPRQRQRSWQRRSAQQEGPPWWTKDKKKGKLRLVLDGRQVNQLFRTPPTPDMGKCASVQHPP